MRGGIFPALVTPVDEQETFQPAVFERLMEHVYSRGADGVYVCGQTGEGLVQSIEQRKRVAEVARRFAADKAVVIHVGASSTAEARELARHAASLGATAISSLPPQGGYSFAEIRDYYRHLSSAADLPILVYHFPTLYPVIQTADQLLELCSLPNVVGLKFTDSDLFKLMRVKQHGAVVFNGFDEMLVAGFLMGADGGIGSIYNLVPGEFVALHRHAIRGEWNEAREIQVRINGLIEVILRYPVTAAVKTLLRWMGIDCGGCISPRRRLTTAEEADLRARAAGTALGQALLAPALP